MVALITVELSLLVILTDTLITTVTVLQLKSLNVL